MTAKLIKEKKTPNTFANLKKAQTTTTNPNKPQNTISELASIIVNRYLHQKLLPGSGTL